MLSQPTAAACQAMMITFVFYNRLNNQVMERERNLSVRMLVMVRMMTWCCQYVLDSHQPGACSLLTILTAVWMQLYKLTPMQPPSATTLRNTLKHKHNVCHIDLGTFICWEILPSSFFTITPKSSMFVDCKSTSFHSIEVLWPTQPGSSIWTQILCTRSSPLGQHATVRKSCLHHN